MLFFAVLSCHYFDKQVPSEKELLEQRLKEINWNQVDEYPSTIDCENLTDSIQRKQCFFEFMATTLQQKLSNDSLKALFPKDTIDVKVTVNADSTVQFEPQYPANTNFDKAKIDSLLQQKLADFPKVNPALKRGIPVKTQFVLPVIVKTN